MKKPLFLIILAIGLVAILPADIVTNPADGAANVGDTFWFRLTCTDPADARWYWGDGQSLSGVPANLDWHSHVYRDPGIFTVHMSRYNFVATPNCLGMENEYRTVTIFENRSITPSIPQPKVGQVVTYTAVNFRTPQDITWDMGDGTLYAHQKNVISHSYARNGTFVIRAYDWRGDTKTVPVSLTVVIARGIFYTPAMPRVDEPVDIQAQGFNSDLIDWIFGDGSPLVTYSPAVSHRYQNPGSFTITAKEHGLDVAPESKAITILPENRSLSLSAPEVRPDEPLTVTAINFRSRLILWDFGDRTVVSGPPVMTHAFQRAGNYVITARDENGASEKKIQVTVKILGVSDQVNLEIAEITLDNGKYYKVIPRNSPSIRALLKMKLRGTGIVSGYWIVDDKPYQFFNETVYQGQIKTIITPEIPGLPVFNPGMHTITVQLTRPQGEAVVFPTLRYFVLPYENVIETLSPRDGAVVKEDQVAKFSWQRALGGSYYQISFTSSLFPLLRDDAGLKWLDCPNGLDFTPQAQVWNIIQRNQWTYWKVRALDSAGNIVAESSVQELKIIIPGAEIGIQKITDMDGKSIALGSQFTAARNDQLLIHGQLTYPGDAEYLILRVYANNELVDQLLFRDVKKDERKMFETSVPNMEKESRVIFEVLKSSSPSVVIGYAELNLKRE
jgi:PKD repeat protein